MCEYLYAHPEGLDPPDHNACCAHIPSCHRFTTVEAKRGDVLLLHGLLPHTNSLNYRHYARVIGNPHATLKAPFNLDRADGDYVSAPATLSTFPLAGSLTASTSGLHVQRHLPHLQSLCEQVILRALNRPCIPDYTPLRPRIHYYPRTAGFKRAKIQAELERLVAAAKAKGLDENHVDSVYLKGEEAMREHERRNGYDLPVGPNGLNMVQHQ